MDTYVDIAGRSTARGVKQKWVWKTSYFRAKSVIILQTVGDKSKVTIMTNIKLLSIETKIDDLG